MFIHSVSLTGTSFLEANSLIETGQLNRAFTVCVELDSSPVSPSTCIALVFINS